MSRYSRTNWKRLSR